MSSHPPGRTERRYPAARRSQVSPRRSVRVAGSPPGTGPQLGPIRLTATRATVIVALVGSLAYLAYAITVRDPSQIPMLAAGAAVLGLVFAVLALFGLVATWRAATSGGGGQAFVSALLGGIAAIIAAGCFAAAVILSLVLRSG